MATLTAARGAQYPLIATFVFDIAAGDVMVNTAGTSQTFKATTGVFDAIRLPVGAVAFGGAIVVDTVSNDSGTATIAVGDSTTNNRYLAATTIKTLGRTAFTPTGFDDVTGLDLRITLANQNGDATTGKVRVQIEYIVDGRVNEVI